MAELTSEAAGGQTHIDARDALPSGGFHIHLTPADVIAIGAPIGFGLLTIANRASVPNWIAVCLALFGVSGLGLAACAWATKSEHRLARLAADFYCMATIWVAYSRAGKVVDILSPATYDRELQAIDAWLFGVQPSVWLQKHQAPWLTELLFICYFCFFFWQLGLAFILYNRDDQRRDYHRFLLTVLTFYMMSYFGYALAPAIGPRFELIDAFHQPLQGVWLTPAIEATFWNSPNLRDCFPSGHTGLTLLVLYRAWTFGARRYFWFMLPFGLLLIFSTVYCRFHYVTDVLCALPFIVAVLCVDNAIQKLLPTGLRLTLPFGGAPPKERAT